jgi:hypothetical protein
VENIVIVLKAENLSAIFSFPIGKAAAWIPQYGAWMWILLRAGIPSKPIVLPKLQYGEFYGRQGGSK